MKKTTSIYLQENSRYWTWTRLVSWYFRRYVGWRWHRNLKNIFLLSGIFLAKAGRVVLLGFECRPTINPHNLNKMVETIFEKIDVFYFFWCELPIILTINVIYIYKRNGDIYNGILDIEIGWYWSVGFGAPLSDGHTEKFFFQFQGFFREKPKVSRYWVLNVGLL